MGQGRDGHYSASKSRALPFPEAAVRRAVEDARERAVRLPETEATHRGRGRARTWSSACPDGTGGVIGFTVKDDEKSVIAVEHDRLPSAGAAQERKAFWDERPEALRRRLAEADGRDVQGAGARRERPGTP